MQLLSLVRSTGNLHCGHYYPANAVLYTALQNRKPAKVIIYYRSKSHHLIEQTCLCSCGTLFLLLRLIISVFHTGRVLAPKGPKGNTSLVFCTCAYLSKRTVLKRYDGASVKTRL